MLHAEEKNCLFSGEKGLKKEFDVIQKVLNVLSLRMLLKLLEFDDLSKTRKAFTSFHKPLKLS